MKLSTHILFGIAASLVLCRAIDAPAIVCLIYAASYNSIAHTIIDAVSHERVGRRVRRTPLLHSPSGLLAMGSVPAAIAIALSPQYAPWIFIISVASNFSHYILDLFTHGGVYLMGRRIRAASIPYSHTLANAAVSAASALATACMIASFILDF